MIYCFNVRPTSIHAENISVFSHFHLLQKYQYDPFTLENNNAESADPDVINYGYYIEWIDEAAVKGKEDYCIFYVKMLNNTRPGDDFLLNFELPDYPGCQVYPEDDDWNFLAVYDHKMLWRANLYIDEANDWNDEHRWVEGNEWNLDADGNVVTGDRAGMQNITPVPFTWHDNIDHDIKSVAYNLTSHDTPFDYNEKMGQQWLLLEHSMQNDYNGFSGGNPDCIWPSFYAPGSKIFDFSGESSWGNYIAETDEHAPIEIGGNMTYPYRPGYNSWYYGEENNLPNSVIKQSTGVDCVGFVQRSASYGINDTLNSFSLPDLTSYQWSDQGSVITNRRYIIAESYEKPNGQIVNEIHMDRITFWNNEDDNGNILNLDKVIPGDIIYYWNGNGYHVMMVSNVTISQDGDAIQPGDIEIIEATSWQVSYAAKVHTLANYSGDQGNERNWIIGRLK